MGRIARWLFLFASIGFSDLMGACQPNTIQRVEAVSDQGPSVHIASLICFQAAQDRDLDRLASCYADDAMMLVPGEAIQQGKEEARRFWSLRFANLGYNFRWHYSGPETRNVADLAYETGTYEMDLEDQHGQPVTTKGKFLVVWKRLHSSRWKIAACALSAD